MKVSFGTVMVVFLCLVIGLPTGCSLKRAEKKDTAVEDKMTGSVEPVSKTAEIKDREAAESEHGRDVQVRDALKKGPVDSQLGGVYVESSLAKTGIKVTRVVRTEPGNIVIAYVICDQPLKAKLRLQAFGMDNEEIGRAIASVKFSAGDAAFVDFTFDERTPLSLANHFQLTLVLKPKNKYFRKPTPAKDEQ